MSRQFDRNPRERLVRLVQTLERLGAEKKAAATALADAFTEAQGEGFDTTTLKVVLKLRQMSPDQRRERRALEAIYLAALGMLEGDALPESARRRMDETDRHPAPPPPASGEAAAAPPAPPAPPAPAQPALALKDPDEARRDGGEAAAAGKRIYDNPFPAGDPCRAAWDEGWCAQRKSHGMDAPAAYQRRTDKPADKDAKPAEASKKGAA